jgi:hypothetical protein
MAWGDGHVDTAVPLAVNVHTAVPLARRGLLAQL